MIEIRGTINKNGELVSPETKKLNAYFSDNPNKKIRLTAEIEDPISDSLEGRYLLRIVPLFKQKFAENGEYLSLESTELKMRQLSKVLAVEIPDFESCGFNLVRYMSIKEAGNKKALQYLKDLEMIAAEQYHLILPE